MLPISLSELRRCLPQDFFRLKKRAIAVSGGVDSIALAALLQECLGQDAARTLFTFTVDHGLRPESSEEAQNVHVQLENMGFNHEILCIPDLSGRRTALEENARIARYSALTRACLKYKIDEIYTAHHANDQAETVLLRLLGGSKWQGLSGMRAIAYNPVSSLLYDSHRIRIHRPLLGMCKDRLVATCRDRQLSWYEDPTNEETALISRNAVRQLCSRQNHLPQALQSPAVLHLSAQLQSRFDHLRDRKATLARHMNLEVCPSSGTLAFDTMPVVNNTDWKALQVSILRDLCAIVTPADSIRNDAMTSVLKFMQYRVDHKQQSGSITAGGVIWQFQHGRCKLCRQPSPRDQLGKVIVLLKKCTHSAEVQEILYDKRFHFRALNVKEDLIIRNLRMSDISELKREAQAAGQRDKLRHVLSCTKGLIRFTLPAMFSRTSGRLLGLPTFNLVFENALKITSSLANAHVLDRMLKLDSAI